MKLRKLFTVTILACTVWSMSAAEPVTADPFELELGQNINIPVVPQKNHQSVKENMDRLKSAFEHAGFKVTRVRQGEVLKITLPCSDLFRANSTSLSQEGVKTLSKMSFPEEATGKYKILIAVHTDDTGDTYYADSITAARANAIDDFFSNSAVLRNFTVVPYGLGRDEPLVSNDSLLRRAQNRRVELYIVPELALFIRNKNSRS